MAGVIVRENSVLMVRHLKADRSYWLLPGGGVEAGETMTQALEREIFEETGLVSRVGRLWLVCESIDPLGQRHVVNMCFLAQADHGDPRTGVDQRVVEVRFLTAAQLRQAALYPDVSGPLLDLLERGPGDETRYLGNVWKD